jgi:DNA-binding NtrC family response regulator
MEPTENVKLLLLGCRPLQDVLRDAGLEPHVFDSGEALIRGAPRVGGRACLVEPALVKAMSFAEFVRRLRKQVPFTDVVAWTPEASGESVRRILHDGARDVIVQDDHQLVVERLQEVIESQHLLPKLLLHQENMTRKWRFEGMLSRSQKMWDLFEICVRTAGTEATVLILGETGTGKELLARAYHRRSGRKGRFVAVNCSAVQENLLDSELFGHVRGAYTGAYQDKPGHFRHAEGGTLFLDEIGDIPLQAQYRLLRVLQEGVVRPLGSEQEIPVDVRVIAATSVPLDEAVLDGSFREDLLYRLDVIRLVIPPLRDRPEDILFLFEKFSARYARQYEVKRPELSSGYIDALQEYAWPGNVRQLLNLTERMLLTHGGGRLTEQHFQELVAPPTAVAPAAAEDEGPAPPPGSRAAGKGVTAALGPVTVKITLAEAVDRIEEAYIRKALDRTGGHVGEAARIAGISRRTLLRKMNRHGIDKRRYIQR